MSADGKMMIVGIGDDGMEGLTPGARMTLQAADVLLGASGTLRLLDRADFPSGARRVELDPDMSEALIQVRDAFQSKKPVLLNYGDPLFYGIARYLCDRLGKDRFEVVPHVSSMQMAFARIKESWEDAYLTSLADKPLEAIVERARTAEKIGLFSSERHPPARVARMLLDRGVDYFRAYVCENLGSPDERVTQAELSDLLTMEFHPLHVMVLVRKPNRPDRARAESRYRLFGNPDDAFAQSQPKRGLITQAEVRAIALAQMDIRPESIIWDIGAGSGSVAIEAARLAYRGVAYAVEPEPTDCILIQTNADAFGVDNVRTIAGSAPLSLEPLPQPDAIFIGGTGRYITDVLTVSHQRLAIGGRLVVNVATIDALATAHATLKQLAGDVDLWQVHISRGIEQLDRTRFEAINPTFLLAVTKNPHHGD